jgi:hypothetical protein
MPSKSLCYFSLTTEVGSGVLAFGIKEDVNGLWIPFFALKGNDNFVFSLPFSVRDGYVLKAGLPGLIQLSLK